MEKTFNDWLLSFAGCDGGNVEADTWLCGIEWGYKDSFEAERNEYYKNGLLDEIKQGHVENDPDYDFFTEESFKHQYNLKFYKLYIAIFGENAKQELLKLNLSPIAFREDDADLWNEDIAKATGIKTKSEYFKCKRVVKDVLPSKALICETMIFNQGDHDDAFNPHYQTTVLV